MTLDYQAAGELLQQGLAGPALQDLGAQAAQLPKLESAGEIRNLAAFVVRCAEILELDKLALAGSHLAQDATNADAAHSFGLQLVSAQMPGLATPVLAFAFELAPANDSLARTAFASCRRFARMRKTSI